MPTAAKPEILTVTQVTRRVKGALESEIGQIWVSGEISNWKESGAGHAYFTLKDEASQIDAVIFKGRLNRLRFRPENGLEVVVHGLVTVYERRGQYQINCDEIHPKGMGALQIAFEKLKKKLSEEGLFDEAHKKPLPMLPRRIGIVTSRTGAAIRDILHVLERRFTNVHVLLYPTRVQGEGAAAEIVEGIRALDAYGVDVMIVGRGGGSLEDLWPFNEEAVVRAVFEARTPIISAVGHEVDFCLTDFAADKRAPTPSAAAEIVVREQTALRDAVGQLRRRLRKAQSARLERLRNRLALAAASYALRRPDDIVRQRRQQVDDLTMRLHDRVAERLAERKGRLTAATRALGYLSPHVRVARARETLAAQRSRLARAVVQRVAHQRGRIAPLAARLNALSPLSVLSRGYALAWRVDGTDGADAVLVRDAAALARGDRMRLRFGRGGADAVVESVEEGPDGPTRL